MADCYHTPILASLQVKQYERRAVIQMVKVSTAFQTRRDGNSEVYASGAREQR